MSSTHTKKPQKSKMSELALWRRNRFAPPDRLFYPIMVAIILALIVIALVSRLF